MPPSQPINTPEGLRLHLQYAIEVEHTTIPPYLCALYSIKGGFNQEIESLIRSVVVEEMLHFSLACNLLNAVGGKPNLTAEQLVLGRSFPRPLPYAEDQDPIELSVLTRQQLKVFQRIELPGKADAPAEANRFETIGQFYAAVEDALVELASPGSRYASSLFDPDGQPRQLDPANWTGPQTMFKVSDLQSAKDAITTIVDEGEGRSTDDLYDDDGELSHYGKYTAILAGKGKLSYDSAQETPIPFEEEGIWAADAKPEVVNVRIRDRPGVHIIHRFNDPQIEERSEQFNVAYCEMLAQLHRAFNGQTAEMHDVILRMFTMKQRAAELFKDGVVPTFEYPKKLGEKVYEYV